MAHIGATYSLVQFRTLKNQDRGTLVGQVNNRKNIKWLTGDAAPMSQAAMKVVITGLIPD